MKKLLAAAICALLATPASAGTATVNYSSTGSSPFRETTDSNSYNLPNVTLWDYSAGANGAGVDTSHGLLTDPASAPAWAIGATAAGVPANAQYFGMNVGGNLTGVPGTAYGLDVDESTSSQLHSDLTAPIPTCGATPCTNNIGNVYQVSQYPPGATPVTASATGTTGATTATLAAVASNYNFVCGYSIRANATAATTVADTLTGIISGTMTHELWVAPAASGIGIDEQIFNPCIPGSAVNTAIAAVSGAPGSGGAVSSTIWGYYKTTSP